MEAITHPSATADGRPGVGRGNQVAALNPMEEEPGGPTFRPLGIAGFATRRLSLRQNDHNQHQEDQEHAKGSQRKQRQSATTAHDQRRVAAAARCLASIFLMRSASFARASSICFSCVGDCPVTLMVPTAFYA